MSIVWHKKSVNRILINGLEYVYILLLILGSRSLYAHPLVGDYRITEMFLLVSMLLFIVNLDGCRNKLSKRLIVSLLAYMFVAGVYAILGVPGEMMVSYIGRYIVLMPVSILLLYTYSQKCETHVLLLKIPNVMCVLSIISLFFWLFGSTLGIIKPTGTYASLWGDHLNVGMHRSYYGIYFDSQSIRFFGYSGFRNCGIFTEAPMHSMMLVFAISCELFYGLYRGAKLNIPKLALLSFTVITTFSSTGIVLLLLCFGLHVYIHLPSGFQKRVLLMGLTVPAVIAMAYVAYKVVSERSSGTSSWLHRLYGNRTALEYFIKSPIIGTGYGGDEFKSTFTINNVGFAFTFWRKVGYCCPRFTGSRLFRRSSVHGNAGKRTSPALPSYTLPSIQHRCAKTR